MSWGAFVRGAYVLGGRCPGGGGGGAFVLPSLHNFVDNRC
jgi:hypothetical protein